MKKPWQGRFNKDTDALVLEYTASIPFDQRLALIDVRGSIAHVEMLAASSIIEADDAQTIVEGLKEIGTEIEAGKFHCELEFEDIHMNIEKKLVEKIGPIGGKMHTGRSRNDQVALDLHLYVKEQSLIIDEELRSLQDTIITLAEKYIDLLIPGYTHLQRAQPLLFSHHLLAYFWMLKRDRERLSGVVERSDLMPLGAGALAGTGFPIKRELVAKKLSFKKLYENSIDAVSDRDYVIEFLSFASILMMHLSRLCEELINWSSTEFGFIELDDAYTTGSSMMPQKKNPDVAELTRGKSGRVYGHLMAMLTVMKGLPLAYNKDMQEDKEGLFDTIDHLKVILPLFKAMLESMTVNRSSMLAAIDDDYLCATDIADYLVRNSITFRDAHHLVGRMIALCKGKGIRLRELSQADREAIHPLLSRNISSLLDPALVVKSRNCRGGTGPDAVRDQLVIARNSLT